MLKLFLIIFFITPLFSFNLIEKNYNKQLKTIKNYYKYIENNNIYLFNKNNTCFNLKKEKNKNIDNEIFNEKIKLEKEKNGFKFNSGITYSDGDSKANSLSTYAGFSYDFFKNGRYNSLNNLKKIKSEKILFNFFKKNSNDEFYNINSIIYSFAIEKIKLNKKILKYLYMLKNLKEEKVSIHEVGYEEVLDIMQQITRIKSLNLENQLFLKNNNKFHFNYSMNCLGNIFDINIQKLLKDMEIKDENIKLHKAIEDNINAKYSKYKDYKLKAYGYATTNDTKLGYKAGITVEIPLYNQVGSLKKLEKEKYNNKIKNINENRKYSVQKLYYEYKYSLDDLIKFYYQYEKNKYILEENMFSYNQGFTKNINNVVKQIYILLLIERKILKVKENLYLKAEKIFNISLIDFNYKYIKYIDLDIKHKILKKDYNFIYIWANGFKKYDNKLLFQFFKKNNFKNLLISASRNQDFNKLNKFIKLTKNKIKIQLLLSSNNWIKNYKNIKNKIKFLNKYNLDYHLDIEMNTFKDFKKNKKYYYKRYTNMLKKIYKYKNKNSKINISIPIYYDNNFLNKIKKYVNKFYVMAYGTKDILKISKKLKKYKSIKNNFILVLNVKDFKNMLELKIFIKKIKKELHLKNIAINDLKNIIRLDNEIY